MHSTPISKTSWNSFSVFACHLLTRAMLIFSASFQYQHMFSRQKDFPLWPHVFKAVVGLTCIGACQSAPGRCRAQIVRSVHRVCLRHGRLVQKPSTRRSPTAQKPRSLNSLQPLPADAHVWVGLGFMFQGRGGGGKFTKCLSARLEMHMCG